VSNRTVKVGLVQNSCSDDLNSNLNKAIEGIRNAASKGAQIICLQELFGSLYFCDVEDHKNFKLAEAIPGPTTQTFSSLAAELGVVIIASLFEKRALEILDQCFPDKNVVGVDSLDLIWGLGSFHCLSQQEPLV
jgi:N-carbamoylputrescine amidase